MSTINRDQTGSLMESKSGPEVARSSNSGQTSALSSKSKADSRYWLQAGRLKFHDSPNYSARIQAEGKRTWFPLGTPNKKAAAAKASEIYSHIQFHGLAAAVDKYKPKATKTEQCPITVGDVIVSACRFSTARKQSLDAYSKAFRRIVSELKGIPDERKFDAKGGGSSEWRRKVDRIPMANLSPVDVIAWKNRRLKDAESNALAKRRAIVTVNSLIRNAKALFGKKVLPFIEQETPLPRPLPFDGVSLEKSPSMRYVSKMDPYAILASAKDELAETDPEAFKVMVLALVCGMRRSEIDNLLWRAFDFQNSALRIEPSEFHQLKSEDSAGVIDLNADTVTLFRGYRAKNPKSLFVIESPNPPRSEMKARCYRCDAVFKRVLAWLRAQGVETTKPLHTLRKEIGSIIASEHGIFEASRYLRHSDIRITSAIYADKKKSVTPTVFAGLLGQTDITPIAAPPSEPTQTIQSA